MPVVRIGHSDGQVTAADIPDGESWTDTQRLLAVTHDDGANEGIWSIHKRLSGSETPAWVASNDPEFEERLARHFGCAQGEPSPETEVTE
jgi:hypothetical protein